MHYTIAVNSKHSDLYELLGDGKILRVSKSIAFLEQEKTKLETLENESIVDTIKALSGNYVGIDSLNIFDRFECDDSYIFDISYCYRTSGTYTVFISRIYMESRHTDRITFQVSSNDDQVFGSIVYPLLNRIREKLKGEYYRDEWQKLYNFVLKHNL